MSYTRIDPEVEAYVTRQIASGFADPLELGECAAEVYEVDVDICEALVDAAVAAHERTRATWPAVTDCDRLDRAFADLERSGVLARHHFACCNNCGNHEMTDVVHDEREQGRRIDGYVFYHWQDTDAAIDGRGLSLRYHSTGFDVDTMAIGTRTVEALRAHGLTTEWDGNPARTIQVVPFDWKRRSPPPPYPTSPALTARSCVERWCDELPRLAASDMALALGDAFADAAIAIGDIDLALTWSRAHLVDAGRSSALGRVAAALRSSGAPGVRDLVLEALGCAPWGPRGGMVDLLIDADLSDPVVAMAMRRRVLESRKDVRGAAEVAWLVVRSRLSADEEAHFLDQVERARAVPDRYGSDAGPRLALDAALWIVRARRGEAEAANEARQRVLDVFVSSEIYGLPPSSIRAVITAAGEETGAPAEIAEHVQTCASAFLPDLLDAYIRTGDLDGALALDPTGVMVNARLACVACTDPRAASWFATAESADAALDEAWFEGLHTADEVRVARLTLAAARAQRDRAGARDAVTTIARAEAAKLADAAQPGQAAVEEVAAGSAPTFPVEHDWLTPDGEAALAKALAKWEAVDDKRSRFRARRQCGKIFNAAAAFARHGDRARALSLIERGFAGGGEDVMGLLMAPLVTALVATDQLDRALELVTERRHRREAAAVVPIVVALVGQGRVTEALDYLGPVLDAARTSEELHMLAPAVLAVASDPRATATAMLAAFPLALAAASALAR